MCHLLRVGRRRHARVQSAIGCGACRHALPLVCVGCAGAVVAHLTAAVRRVVAQKRVQNGPYTKVAGQSPQKENGVKIALWERGFSPLRWPPPRHLRGFRPCAGAGGDVVSSSYLQSPRMAGGRHVPALGSARAEASWLVSSKPRRLSAPGLGSAWRGPMAAQADHGQLCSASRGTRPVSLGRDMVHLARFTARGR